MTGLNVQAEGVVRHKSSLVNGDGTEPICHAHLTVWGAPVCDLHGGNLQHTMRGRCQLNSWCWATNRLCDILCRGMQSI